MSDVIFLLLVYLIMGFFMALIVLDARREPTIDDFLYITIMWLPISIRWWTVVLIRAIYRFCTTWYL